MGFRKSIKRVGQFKQKVDKTIGGVAKKVGTGLVKAYTGGLVDLGKKAKEGGGEDYRGEAAESMVRKKATRAGGSGQVKFNTIAPESASGQFGDTLIS